MTPQTCIYVCCPSSENGWDRSHTRLNRMLVFCFFNFSKLPRVHREALSNMLPEQGYGLTSAVQGDGAVDGEVDCPVHETVLQTVQIIRSSAVINQPRKAGMMGVK